MRKIPLEYREFYTEGKNPGKTEFIKFFQFYQWFSVLQWLNPNPTLAAPSSEASITRISKIR